MILNVEIIQKQKRKYIIRVFLRKTGVVFLMKNFGVIFDYFVVILHKIAVFHLNFEVFKKNFGVFGVKLIFFGIFLRKFRVIL